MLTLHQRLSTRVAEWRDADYPSESFPAIGELLEWSRIPESGELRYLRQPQLRALETYWYLRLVEPTPHIVDLYRRLFPSVPELLAALGLDQAAITNVVLDIGVEGLFDRIRTDDGFVKDLRLQAVRETLTLDYPSYILALAMGSGKTVLVGATIATEFAMALEYPDADFVQNALVFAPGKTIIESLRELMVMPYDRLLPPRFHARFAAAVKLTFTRDGDPDVPVVDRSLFNIVVTNTEKIRIQKEQIRKSDVGSLLSGLRAEEARGEIANRRLLKIASLPHLGIFSDEAHHTYGQALDTELKKVRKTVDYLAATTNVVAVVNTTGTPYFQKQPLRDVVVWYGLSQGIRDGILKDVTDNIIGYEFDDAEATYVGHVVDDFFQEYGAVRLPDGSPAKLAMYFPQTDDVAALRPAIDAAMVRAGLGPAQVLVNTSKEPAQAQEEFNRLNDPASPYRVILLVNRGTEGWNCPSLFACALVRKLTASNNFVLQAATRCLRQVAGNTRKARIYLSSANFNVLDKQLQETYGESIEMLGRERQELRRAQVIVRKPDAPPLHVTREVTRVVPREGAARDVAFSRPKGRTAAAVARSVYTIGEQAATARLLRQTGDVLEIESDESDLEPAVAAVDLAARYRLDAAAVAGALRAAYRGASIPQAHLADLEKQIEAQVCLYDTVTERVDVALALVKPEGFAKTSADGETVYAAEILYPLSREPYVVHEDAFAAVNRFGFGFHCEPYDFDSNPEKHFFEQILRAINLAPSDVEDVYFTGGITAPAKTDFFVEYKDAKGKWRRYTPDFVIRKKAAYGQPAGSGRVYIVEVKAENRRDDPVEGETGRKAMAVRALEGINPDRLKYEIIFTRNDSVRYPDLQNVIRFAEEPEPYLPLPINREQIAAFCRKWKIVELDVFGSVLRPDFGPDSDVDFLATFAPDARIGFDIVTAEDELGGLVGRKVDLVDRRSIDQSYNWIRKKAILDSARPFYVG